MKLYQNQTVESSHWLP